MAVTYSKHRCPCLKDPSFDHHIFDIYFCGNLFSVTVTATASVAHCWLSEMIEEISGSIREGNPLVVGLGVHSSPLSTIGLPPADTVELCIGQWCLIFQLSRAKSVPHLLRGFLEHHSMSRFVGFWNICDRQMLWGSRHKLQMDEDPMDLRTLLHGTLFCSSVERIVEICLGYSGVRTRVDLSMSDWSVETLTDDQVLEASIRAYCAQLIGRNYKVWRHSVKMAAKPFDLLGSIFSRVRIPELSNRIHKHECCVSFDSPRSEGGLFVDLYSFVAFGKDFVDWNYDKTGNPFYLHIKQTKKSIIEDNEPEYEESHSIVILPEYVYLPFPYQDLPEIVKYAADAILVADKKQASPYATNLQQINKDLVMPQSGQDTNFDWNRIQESGQELDPIFGAGYTGLVNIGNSCYMAAIMQLVFSTTSFISRYYLNQSLKEAFEVSPPDPTMDLNMQLTKLAHGLLSGDYSVPSLDNDENFATSTITLRQEGIRPSMFKSVIASEFSSVDASEFFLHFLHQVERANAGKTKPDLDPTRSLKFGIEDRILCTSSGKIAYKRRNEYILSLNIPLDEATNKEELELFHKEEKEIIDGDGIVRPKVPLEACLANFLAPEDIHDFYDSSLKRKRKAVKSAGLTSFPDYLVLHMRRYVMDGGTKKLHVYIDVPDIIDISHMRSKGHQSGEELLPDDEEASNKATSKVGLVEEEEEAEKEAMNWLLPHMDDLHMDQSTVVDTFGFQEESADASVSSMDVDQPDAGGRYRLTGIVSHGGTSMQCGHYVAHVFKEGRWVIFNDDKVASSINPPKEMGYLYFFQRL